MTKFSNIIPLLDMYEKVYIYTAGGNKGMIFNGELRNLPIEVYLGIQDMPVTCMYPAVNEGDDEEVSTAYLNIILECEYD